MTAPRPSLLLPAALCASLLLGLPGPGRAGTETIDRKAVADTAAKGDIWNWPVMTGDWGGVRSRLADNGVSFTSIYSGEILASLTGGKRAGSTYMGCFYLAMTVDGDKFLPWKGFTFQAATLDFNGSSLTSRYVGDLFNTSVNDFNDGWRLWELWVQQSLFDDRLQIRVGQYAPYFQFAVTPDATLFDNINFQRLGVLSAIGNLGSFQAFNMPAPGVQIKYRPTANSYVMAAIYNGSPDPTAGAQWDNGRSLKLNIYQEQGALTLYEAGYLWNQEPGATGLPGAYKVGAAYHTDSRFTATGAVSDNYAVYGIVDQTVWRGTAAGGAPAPTLSVFYRAGGAPGDRNLFDFYTDGGIAATGAIPGRPYDVAALGAGYGQVTDDPTVPFGAGKDFEAVVQGTYRMQLTPWWSIQPISKLSIHPGGSDLHGNAFMVGMETTVAL